MKPGNIENGRRAVFLATLGQRPQAITMALDHLLPSHDYRACVILHTDPDVPDEIGGALDGLLPVLNSDYGTLPVESRCLCDSTGRPIADINGLQSAEGYFHAVVAVIREYRIQHIPVHLLVAGGRKAMSVYATLAASLLFGEYDRVWTILTSPELMQTGAFHAPPSRTQEVELVNLPVKPSRLLPGIIAEIPVERLLEQPAQSPRHLFLAELTREENALLEMLRQHPYASNKDLSAYLDKAPKTIENQFRSIYNRLAGYYDLERITSARKREILLDVIDGRI